MSTPCGDLVLLDLNLPKRDGLSVLAAMKAGPDLRRIPVVIFSTSELRRISCAATEWMQLLHPPAGNLIIFFRREDE